MSDPADPLPLSRAQRLVSRFVAPETLAAMRADTMNWVATCKHGHRTDLWTLGGIRYKATKNTKKSLIRCPVCGRMRWMTLRYEAPG
jgi:hypothetical protein